MRHLSALLLALLVACAVRSHEESFDIGNITDIIEPTDSDKLVLAAQGGEYAECVRLLSEGVDPNAFSLTLNNTALVAAAERNHTDVVAQLLLFHADPNIREPVFGETALFKASFKGFEDVAALLLAEGADPTLTIKNDETCLMWASFKGHDRIAQLLLRGGAVVNARDTKYGFTPLMVAARNGHASTVRLLLVHGADVNAKDNSGATALAMAESRGHSELAGTLRELGAKEEVAALDEL